MELSDELAMMAYDDLDLANNTPLWTLRDVGFATKRFGKRAACDRSIDDLHQLIDDAKPQGERVRMTWTPFTHVDIALIEHAHQGYMDLFAQLRATPQIQIRRFSRMSRGPRVKLYYRVMSAEPGVSGSPAPIFNDALTLLTVRDLPAIAESCQLSLPTTLDRIFSMRERHIFDFHRDARNHLWYRVRQVCDWRSAWADDKHLTVAK